MKKTTASRRDACFSIIAASTGVALQLVSGGDGAKGLHQ